MKIFLGGLAIAVVAGLAWFFLAPRPRIDPAAEDARAAATVREIADYASDRGQLPARLRGLFSVECKDGCNTEKTISTLGRVKRIVEQSRLATETDAIFAFISRHSVAYRMLVEFEKATAQVRLTLAGVGEAAVVRSLAIRTPGGSSPFVELYSGHPADLPKGKDW